MAGPPGTPKEAFIDGVRRALNHSRRSPEPPQYRWPDTLAELERQAQALRLRLERDRAVLLDRLAVTAQLRGWQVHRTADPEDIVKYLGAIAAATGVRQAVRSDQPVFGEAPVDAALRDLGVDVLTVARDEARSRDWLRQRIAVADLGITGADYAVAETGSVVVAPRRDLSRLVSVVPPVHLALVRPQDLVDTLDDLFLLRRLEYYRNQGEMGSCLNLITGPSRTADIEQTLVVGVHGPKEVHLVLLG